MTAAKYRLGNLTAILDYNDVQLDGPVHEIIGESRGWVMTGAAANTDDAGFQSDRKSEQHTASQLKHIAVQPGQELTFTCVPCGSGTRIGIDRDEDSVYDADDLS